MTNSFRFINHIFYQPHILPPTTYFINHIFYSIEYGNILKLEGSKLKPPKYVKYLGIFIDELSKKISRANGILAKLRYFATKKILILVYYAIFYS